MISALGSVLKSVRHLASRSILAAGERSDAGKAKVHGLRHRRPAVERLESRQLLTASLSVKEIPLPDSGSLPFGITMGRGGDVWFTEQAANKIGVLNPRTDAIQEFAIPTPHSLPGYIAAGSDGNLWFTEPLAAFGQGDPLATGKLGEINPRTHAIHEFEIPSGTPTAITAGNRGSIWFIANAVEGFKIGRIDLKTHVIQEYSLDVPTGAYISEITTDARHDLDFAGVSPSGSGVLGEFNPRTLTTTIDPNPIGIPSALTTGADGNLRFTQTPSYYATNSDLVRFSPRTQRTQAIPLSSSDPLFGAVMTQTQGHDFWATAANETSLWQINPHTHAVAELPLPTDGTQGITAGRGRQIWITQAQVSYSKGISPDGFAGFVQVVGSSSLAEIRYTPSCR